MIHIYTHTGEYKIDLMKDHREDFGNIGLLISPAVAFYSKFSHYFKIK